MDILANDQNSDILQRLAPQGRLETPEQFDRLDAADGKADGQFHLSGLSAQDQASLKAARAKNQAVTVRFDKPSPKEWKLPAIQESYGRYIGDRWEAWKARREEADCKTTALRFMEDFRQFFKDKVGVSLSDPIPKPLRGTWRKVTSDKPGPILSQLPADPKSLREDYKEHAGKKLLAGPNHVYLHISADQVAKHATQPVTSRQGQPMVHPYQTAKSVDAQQEGGYPGTGTPIVNANLLLPGDIIFQSHDPAGVTIHHTINVLNVDRDAKGNVSKIRFAIGTFDDIRDFDGSTNPGGRLNQYNVESEMTFDADGDIKDYRYTWVSDPFMEKSILGGNDEPVETRVANGYTLLGVNQNGVYVHRWGK